MIDMSFELGDGINPIAAGDVHHLALPSKGYVIDPRCEADAPIDVEPSVDGKVLTVKVIQSEATMAKFYFGFSPIN